MSSISFRALRITETAPGQFARNLIERQVDDLPAGEVLVRVHYAALNYKDALSATGNKGVTRRYPHTPGIDAAGIVAESTHADIQEGDAVIVTSYDLGMNTDGAFAEYIRVPASWVVPLPEGLTLRESMIVGTAGVTAGIGLHKMEQMGQHPELGEVVVTGASGGVGSMAVGILAQAGYAVTAATGSASAHTLLTDLGATKIVDRSYVDDDSGRPLLRSQWAGAIDTVGGNTLATLLKACQREGNVATCGLVGSAQLATTVFPFILNGVNLLGIDSATYPISPRRQVWQRLATDWRVPDLDRLATDCTLATLDPYLDRILRGDTQGRVIVNLTENV